MPIMVNKGVIPYQPLSKMKKGQFKIQQMAFMLVAVFLFFILVALFWLSFQYRNLSKLATQGEENKAIVMSEFLSDSSEFGCAHESYCIDTDKVMILKDKSTYKNFWPVSYIKIRKLDGKEDRECDKVNYPDCNIYKVYGYNNGSGVGSFVALCRYEQVEGYATKVCEIGKIIIGYESK